MGDLTVLATSEGLTKAELVEEVARVTQLTKKQAEEIVNTVFHTIVDSLAQRPQDRAARIRELPHPESGREDRPEPQDRGQGRGPAQAHSVLQARQGAQGATQPAGAVTEEARTFSPGRAIALCVLAWLVPSAGHFALRRRGRAAVFALLVLVSVLLGVHLDGNLHRVVPGQPLSTLFTLGAMGLGAPYFVLRYGARLPGGARGRRLRVRNRVPALGRSDEPAPGSRRLGPGHRPEGVSP